MATRGLVLVLATGASLYVMALTTGSGWVMVLFCAVVATLAVSGVWSLRVLRAITLGAAGPSDAVAGDPLRVTVRTMAGSTASVRLRMAQQSAANEPQAIGAAATFADTSRIEVDAVAPPRGVCRRASFELTCGAPLGLVWWRRRDSVVFDAPTLVAPRPSRRRVAIAVARESGDGKHPGHATSDLVRDVREYRPGDPLRVVHWPATARTGLPMVRELEREDARAQLILVDLTGPDGERAAEDAAGRAIAALGAGRPVRMVTMEATGPVNGIVASARDVGRRLARAVTSAAPSSSDRGPCR